MEHDRTFEASGPAPEPGAYRPRTFARRGIHRLGGIDAKLYTILADGREPIDVGPVVEYGRRAVAGSTLDTAGSRGLGYAILHRGEEADWLLLRAWREGDIVAGLLHADRGAGLAPVTEPFVECVWEAVLTAHERDAWVRAAMSGAVGADEVAERYLSDALPDGRY